MDSFKLHQLLFLDYWWFRCSEHLVCGSFPQCFQFNVQTNGRQKNKTFLSVVLIVANLCNVRLPQVWMTACSNTCACLSAEVCAGRGCWGLATPSWRSWEFLASATRSSSWRPWTCSVLWWVWMFVGMFPTLIRHASSWRCSFIPVQLERSVWLPAEWKLWLYCLTFTCLFQLWQ